MEAAASASARADVEQGARKREQQGEPITFRDLREEDLPVVKALHNDLFPVKYSDSFFQRLFSTGYFCLVGLVEGEIIAVASARCCESNGEPSKEAYIMTLGVRVRSPHGTCVKSRVERAVHRSSACHLLAGRLAKAKPRLGCDGPHPRPSPREDRMRVCGKALLPTSCGTARTTEKPLIVRLPHHLAGAARQATE